MNIYIGNLPYSVTEKQLTDLFLQYGPVKSAKVIIDKITGNSKGFGFVEMESDEEAQQAIEQLNGKEIDGRRVRVIQARSESGAPAGGHRGGGRSDFRSRGGHGGGDSDRSFRPRRSGGFGGSRNSY